MVYQRKPCQNANSFTYNNKDIQIHELEVFIPTITKKSKCYKFISKITTYSNKQLEVNYKSVSHIDAGV